MAEIAEMASQSEGNKISYISFISAGNKNYPHEIIMSRFSLPKAQLTNFNAPKIHFLFTIPIFAALYYTDFN